MDKDQKTVAKVKMAAVDRKMSEARMYVTDGDSYRAFVAAEEAYMLAWEAKDYLSKVFDKDHPQTKEATHVVGASSD